MINRLGHGISYTALMEIQTENAYMIVDQQMQSGCVLPVNCQKEVFTIYVADNIDRNEETLSGMFISYISSFNEIVSWPVFLLILL